MVYTVIMSGRDLVKILMKNNWELDRVKGSHYILRKNGISISVPVHKNEDLKPGILDALMKKAGLKK